MENVFLLEEAAHCCRALLEEPAYPSGSQVHLFSYSVTCNDKYFTSEFNKIDKK